MSKGPRDARQLHVALEGIGFKSAIREIGRRQIACDVEALKRPC